MSSPDALDPQQRPLPTPRAFLTSLLKSLSTSPPRTSRTSGETETGTRERVVPAANPLSAISGSQKSLLATLHVLFPPPTLLQALDLLDRGLVTRIHVSDTNDSVTPHTGQASDGQVRQDVNEDEEGQPPPRGEAIDMDARDRITTTKEDINHRKNTFYTVRSAQSRNPHHRHGDIPTAAPGLMYTVQIHAWSCSCAAFAFAAFPPLSPSHPSSPSSSEDEEEEEDIDVGGLSLKGDDDAGVPICKHLLACLLAERWEEVFGSYVEERKVNREEAGGICAA